MGLVIEFNAQNLLVAMDSKNKPSGLILRDLMGLEKDYGYRSELWPTEFFSAPYKCIKPSDQSYQIRHSFAFDFKLSYYIVSPFIEFVRATNPGAAEYLLSCARGLTNDWCAKIDKQYFPRGSWFAHPKVFLTSDRPYEEHVNPYLRS